MNETKPANVLYHTLLYCALVKVDWASVAFLGHADQGRMWKLMSLKTEKKTLNLSHCWKNIGPSVHRIGVTFAVLPRDRFKHCRFLPCYQDFCMIGLLPQLSSMERKDVSMIWGQAIFK